MSTSHHHHPKPTVGRIVHYYPFGDFTQERPIPFWAAIVTDVKGPDLIDLTAFPNGSHLGSTPPSYSQVPRRGTWPEGALHTVGFWDWPPRD